MAFKHGGCGLTRALSKSPIRFEGSGSAIYGDVFQHVDWVCLQSQCLTVLQQIRTGAFLSGMSRSSTAAVSTTDSAANNTGMLGQLAMGLEDYSALTSAVMLAQASELRSGLGIEPETGSREELLMRIDRLYTVAPHLRHLRFNDRHVHRSQLSQLVHLAQLSDTHLNVRLQYAVAVMFAHELKHPDPAHNDNSDLVERLETTLLRGGSAISTIHSLNNRLFSPQEQAAQLVERLCFTRIQFKKDSMSVTDGDGVRVDVGAAEVKILGRYMLNPKMDTFRQVDPSGFLQAFSHSTVDEVLGISVSSFTPDEQCVWLEHAVDTAASDFVERKTGVGPETLSLSDHLTIRLYGYDAREYYQQGAHSDKSALVDALDILPGDPVLDIVQLQQTGDSRRFIACWVGNLETTCGPDIDTDTSLTPDFGNQEEDGGTDMDTDTCLTPNVAHLWPSCTGGTDVVNVHTRCLGLAGHLLSKGHGSFESNHCSVLYTEGLSSSHVCSKVANGLMTPGGPTGCYDPNGYIQLPAIARSIFWELGRLGLKEEFEGFGTARRNECLLKILLCGKASMEAKAMALYSYHDESHLGSQPFHLSGTWSRGYRQGSQVITPGWQVTVGPPYRLINSLVVPVLDLTLVGAWAAGFDINELEKLDRVVKLKLGPRSAVRTLLTPQCMAGAVEGGCAGFGDIGAILLEGLLRNGVSDASQATQAQAILCVGSSGAVRDLVRPLTMRHTFMRRQYGPMYDDSGTKGTKKVLYWRFKVAPGSHTHRLGFVYQLGEGAKSHVALALEKLRGQLGFANHRAG